MLRGGEIELVGRLVESSNNALLARVGHPVAESLAWEPPPSSPLAGLGRGLYAVWKPTAGERPLFDFPPGTLTHREVAAFAVSEALGWRIVPPSVLRDGPYGEGMLQRWIEVDPAADLVAMIVGADMSTVALTRTTWDYLKSKGVQPASVYPILNRSVGLEGLTRAEIEQMLGIPIKVSVPYLGSNFSMANNQHQPYSSKFPRDTASIVLKDTAQQMIDLAKRQRAS